MNFILIYALGILITLVGFAMYVVIFDIDDSNDWVIGFAVLFPITWLAIVLFLLYLGMSKIYDGLVITFNKIKHKCIIS